MSTVSDRSAVLERDALWLTLSVAADEIIWIPCLMRSAGDDLSAEAEMGRDGL